MDPLTIIVTALASGAAARLTPTVEQAIKDGYAALKTLIGQKYKSVSVGLLEQDPASESRRAVIKEELARTDASRDEELLRATKTLLDQIQQRAPESAAAIGADLNNIKAASLAIEDVNATGTGVKASNVEAPGNVTRVGRSTTQSATLMSRRAFLSSAAVGAAGLAVGLRSAFGQEIVNILHYSVVYSGVPVVTSRSWTTGLAPNPRGGWNFITESYPYQDPRPPE
jgi:hypothetical protein